MDAAGVGSFCEQVTQRVLTDPFFSSIINEKDVVMWRVRYYMVGGTRATKLFPTLTEATHFVVYKIRCCNVYEFIKVKE